MQERTRCLAVDSYERAAHRNDHGNGFYERDFLTRFGTLRLRIARTRKRAFLPAGLQKFQRRAEEVMLLIREAFLRGISTRQVGRVVAILTGEPVSAQTVSKLSRSPDQAVQRFQEAPIKDEWAYLFLDGVSLRVRRPAGRKRVQLLVAYGVRRDGSRQLLGFVRSGGESQAAWEGLLNDLYRRGLTGKNLKLIVTDGCSGLAAALAVVYPKAVHQRCWVHKMRNILERVRKRDYQAVKQGGGRRSTVLRTKTRPRRRSVDSSGNGNITIRRWFGNWRRICWSCFPSSASEAPMEEAADHQRDRAVLCGGPSANATDGLLRQRKQRGSDRVFHLQQVQRAVAKPDPSAFYTSSLTSPAPEAALT